MASCTKLSRKIVNLKLFIYGLNNKGITTFSEIFHINTWFGEKSYQKGTK